MDRHWVSLFLQAEIIVLRMIGRRIASLALCCFPLFAGAEDAAGTVSGLVLPPDAERYLQQLVAQAAEDQLAQRPEWRNLLHYKSYPLIPGGRSLNDDPDFFLAPDGKTNPSAELVATLRSFFSTIEETDREQNPQCRFIARYHWLNRELNFDPARLPPKPCGRFERWRASLDPAGITLIFPAAYLNNPASMYGHTLLRIDGKDQDERTRLLAYAVNYAANTNETSGLVFAVKGLLGGYPGQFSIAPYYSKVKEYNDIENRDIWEYELNLTTEEIDRLLMHLWELGPTYFDYYFFDENCSYHLLSLLEVARPDLRLTDRFRWWAIPADTVRAVTRQPGLVKRAVYRPANTTILRYRLSRMNEAERAMARELAERRLGLNDERLRRLPQARQAVIIETAYEYAVYRRLAGRTDGEKAAAYERTLLLARSELSVPGKPRAVPQPAVRPDQGHETARFTAGAGREDGRGFTEIRLRPAYHDLLDPEGGYTRGAQIQFFDLALRKYESAVVKVDQFKLLDIISLSPRDDYFKSVSWKINAGWSRERFPDGHEPMVFRLNGGAGLAWAIPDSFSSRMITYFFLEASLDIDNKFERGFALGAGPAAGLLADVSSAWRVHLFARSQRFGVGGPYTEQELALEQRISLSKDTALRLGLSRRRRFDHYWNGASLSWHLYF